MLVKVRERESAYAEMPRSDIRITPHVCTFDLVYTHEYRRAREMRRPAVLETRV